MHTLRVGRPRWAGLHHPITDRDNCIKLLVQEHLEVFGDSVAHVNALLLHATSGQWVDVLGRSAPRTKRFNASMTQMAQEGFGHLRAGAVLSTQKEHAEGNLHLALVLALWHYRSGHRWVKCFTRSQVQALEVFHIQTIEDRPFVSTTSPFGHELSL